jgi:hypothetical protein
MNTQKMNTQKMSTQINSQIPTEEGIYGTDDMVAFVEASPLHSVSKGEIKDYGELCDSDCIDCD